MDGPTKKIEKSSYKVIGEYQNRQGAEVISLLIGGQMKIYYMEPEEEEKPWGNDNDYSGPQAA